MDNSTAKRYSLVKTEVLNPAKRIRRGLDEEEEEEEEVVGEEGEQEVKELEKRGHHLQLNPFGSGKIMYLKSDLCILFILYC